MNAVVPALQLRVRPEARLRPSSAAPLEAGPARDAEATQMPAGPSLVLVPVVLGPPLLRVGPVLPDGAVVDVSATALEKKRW